MTERAETYEQWCTMMKDLFNKYTNELDLATTRLNEIDDNDDNEEKRKTLLKKINNVKDQLKIYNHYVTQIDNPTSL